MNSSKNRDLADNFAKDYDQSADKYGWVAPEVVFGMTYHLLEPDEKVLDIGIGTGLSSACYHKAGCRVVGIDGSAKMLEVCAEKGVADELLQVDLTDQQPYPFADTSFDHAIAIGIFHLLGNLSDIIREASRLVRKGGTFGFTIDAVESSISCLEETNEKSGVKLYKYGVEYLKQLLSSNRFRIIKSTRFLTYKKTDWSDEIFFNAFVTRKQ